MSDYYQYSGEKRGKPGEGHRIRVKPAEPTVLPSQVWTAYRKDLTELVELFEPVRVVLSGRLVLLRFVQQIFQRPRERRAADLERVRADHRTMVAGILARMDQNPALVQRLTVAIQRFDTQAELLEQIKAFLASTKDHGQAAAAVAMRTFDIPKVRGQLYLLTTFDLLFRDEPLLSQVFPEIEREQYRPDGPRIVRAQSARGPHGSRASAPPPATGPPVVGAVVQNLRRLLERALAEPAPTDSS